MSAHPDEAEALQKALRAIWVQVTDPALYLPSREILRLTYDMHAPLNLPKYLGTTTGDATVDMNAERNPGLAERLAEVSQWNSFMQRINRKSGANADANALVMEQRMAGAFIDAPEERGYIGDYVWCDFDWDQNQNDTADALTGTTHDLLGRETTYHRADNGRYLLSTGARYDAATGQRVGTHTSDGHVRDTRDVLKDLNYDGKVDDPGMNGVKVELLNENGLPVNRKGEVPKFIQSLQNGNGLWVKCDSETGEPLVNSINGYIAAEGGAPVYYVTESDYYGNKGYWVLSDITPGEYKLRFTFPQEYSHYSITTKKIGPSRENELEITRIEDDPATTENEAALIAETKDAIRIDGIVNGENYDKEKFRNGQYDALHAAYDAKMMSYDVGIARPVIFDGTAFRDDLYADNSEIDPDEIDGYMDWQSDPQYASGAFATDAELRVPYMKVSVHEYDPATGLLKEDTALDADGNPAQVVTGMDGAFSFMLISIASTAYVPRKQSQRAISRQRLICGGTIRWRSRPAMHCQVPAICSIRRF